MAEIERVGVLGCGLMGSGIAEVCARAGLDTVVVEANSAALESGRARIESSLARGVSAGKLDATSAALAQARLSFSTDLGAVADRQITIEAIIERAADKIELFERLDRILTDPEAVLASNTSSIPIISLAAATKRPEQVIGLHFFNPVPVMPLVEVIVSMRTAASVVQACQIFVGEQLGKSTIAAKDRAGFVVNALLIPYLLSAIRMYEANFASAEAIDTGMEKGCAHPMGPLRLCDFIGIDTIKLIADCLYEEYKDPQYVSPPLLLRMVEGGMLGRKSGQGFYSYTR